MDDNKELEKIFEKANTNFLKNNKILFESQVSERTLCGALMLSLYEEIKKTEYSKYFVDVEYNRNVGGKVKTIKKTIQGIDEQIVNINCDLIVHSRGQNVINDNLIAIEMKKSTSDKKSKINDKIRLECLTKRCDVWSYGGKVFPEHVCGYKLGVYYEINFKLQIIQIEYYVYGNCYKQYSLSIKNKLKKFQFIQEQRPLSS